jgi:sensor domain CHASE-containing protein
MTIQNKVSTILVTVMLVFGGTSAIVLVHFMMPAFRSLEETSLQADFARAKKALARDVERVSGATADWAQWDDTYNYIQGRNDRFADVNLQADSLDTLNLDFGAFLDTSGDVYWGQLLGEFTGRRPVLEELGLTTDNVDRLLTHETPESETAGIVTTVRGPMVISARPIVTSDSRGPIAGTLIFGYFLDAERIEELRRRTEVDLNLVPAHGAHADIAAAVVAAPSGRMRERAGPDNVEYGAVTDISGAIPLILSVRKARTIEKLGRRTVQASLAFLGLVAAVVAATIWVLLRHIAVRPLARLTKHMAEIRSSGDLSRRSGIDGGDEIGALSRTFDSLTEELHKARSALFEQSFRAGMAETAAGVMHNLRNAMTPLVNRIANAARIVDDVRDPHLGKAIRELTDTTNDPQRRMKLEEYVALSVDQLDESCDTIRSDLEAASNQAHQVEQILADQERIAHSDPVVETVELRKALVEASGVVPQDGNTMQIEIGDDLDGVTVRAHRVGMVQILGNVLLNAYESIRRREATGGHIAVSAAPAPDDEGMIRVSIRDDGMGISNEQLPRIFERGFSVKRNGYGGLGLHWCANTLASMGGRIAAASEGPGKGARFDLDFPAPNRPTQAQ